MDEVRLKKITDSIGLMQKNLECSICLDLLQDPVSTKCDHQFCNFCVLALLQSSSKPSARCPLCKVVITKRSLTKNEQLDQIVKAVRSVITAVEEDSGLRCSPPRGPVLISQPDPKPRELSPQKKVKSRISSKAKGQRRAGNVRKTKRKAAETVSVYRDDSESSDSDVFELPLVGHTNISSSFPRLKTSGKKGYRDNDQENEELEKEAEDLLAALNAAPLTSHGDVISGYSNGLEQRNNEINLRPINSGNPEEKENHALDSQARTCQNSTPLADSEIFEVPAPRVPGKVNISKQGAKESDKDPYEFVPSQRTPRKVKKKVGRKRNQSGKKEFPILKGRFAKPGAPRRDQKSASSCSESDHDGAMIQSKAKDKPLKNNASSTNLEQRNSEADSKTENASPKSGHVDDRVKETQSHLAQKDGSTTAVTEENILVDSADVVMEDTEDDGFDSKDNAQDMAPPVERNLIRHPLPITPVVVIKRGVGGNVQGSQQSSDGGMLTDSQPVVINRNHGRRVFATTYGKAKNGVDKSPPLDPQERILDWLVSKNAGSDESDYEEEGEDKEKEEAEESEGFEDILIVQENGDAHPASLPIQEDKDVPNKDVSNNVPKLPTVADQPEPAEESEPRENRSEKEKLTPKKNDLNEKFEDQNGRRRSGRRNKESSQEKRTFDHTGGEVETHDIQDSTMDRSQEKTEKERPLRRRTAKQRMEDNLKEHTEAARKESEAAAIKSDWELALELARQFGTEPEHLKAEPDETGGRSSRRRKGKLTIETVPESKPVRKSKRHVQEHQEKENNEQDEVIDIDSYETQNLNKVPVKTFIKEGKSTEAEKRKARTSNRRKRLGRQTDIQTKDRNGEVQETDTPEAKVLRIPETPYILDQAEGKTSLERESPPKIGIAEVESHEKDWKASKQREAFRNMEVLSSKSAEHCTPNSLSSQSLTPPLRRSKRGCHPELPNGSSKVPEHVISDQMEQKEKEKITNKTEKNDKDPDPGNSGENIKVLPDADDLAHQVDFSLQVIEGAEAEEKIDIEETPLASLPLYTEDIPKDDKDFISPKKCRGSDTTESIDLKIDSDEYEDSDDAVEKEQELSSGGSPPKKVICSSPSEKDQDLFVDEKPSSGQSHDVSSFSSENQVKPSLDKEMSIMNRILPSVGSQECPALGVSPRSSGNTSETTSDTREEEVVPIYQKPDEIPQTLSGSSITGKEPSQASVTILSQIKTSGSFPVSLDVNSQPSESLLKPSKQSKRKVSQDGLHGSTLHTQEGDSVKKPTTETSPGAKQQVGSTKGSSVDNDVQEMPISSGSGNSRPARRISRRKRKTFTINACLSVPPSKDKATPPSQEIQQVPDTLEQPTVSLDNQMESELSKEAGQSDRCSYMSGHEETHETDGHNNTDDRKAAEDVEFVENVEAPSWSRALRKSSRSVRDRNSVDVTNERLKSPLTARPVKRKKSKSLPTSDIQTDRKRAAINSDDSAYANPPSASASQETLASDMSGSSLKLKKKSRNSGRHSTQSPVPEMDVEESVRQPNPSDHMIGRLPDDELEGKCKEAPKAAGGRRSSGRNKKSIKSEATASDGSAVPATPGASEIKEHSSNVVIPHRALKLRSKKNIDEGAEIPEKSELTPRSSPRIRNKNSVQRQKGTTASNKADEEENLEQRISTPPQECITIVDEGIGVSLAEKEESQESNKSLHSVEEIFSHHEESRDMFDEVEITENQEAMGIEESQSLNAEIVLLPEDLNAKDVCGPGEIDDAESRAGCTRAKQDVQKKSTGIAKKLQHLSVPHEIDGRKDGTVLQGSSQFEDTEALIPPTPPCHNLSKSLASSFVHASGLSKPLPKRKQAQEKMAPDMSSLLGPSQDIIADKQNTVQAKSLVVETPTVVSRRRNKVPHSQTEDRSIADTPVKPKQRSVGQKGKVGSSDHDAVTVQGKDQEDVFEHSEMSPEKSSESKAGKRMTSQTINDTPLELPIKSSNESDEVMRTTAKRRKQVILDDDSDDDDKEDDNEIIGRQKRKAQRMVQVGRDEEDESDDELISCSFLQTSVQKEDNDDENPLETFGGKANPHLDHEPDGGSVSSEDSCASHHMNLTSASSILSSQSEIMNTQQQEKTREDMQALEEQMAELQAALARERGGSRSTEDTNGEDEEEEEKEEEEEEEKEEEEEEEDPQDLLVEEAEGAHTPDAKQNNSLRSNGRSPKRTKLRNKQVEISDEEDNDEMEEEDLAEPRSPSPPPPLSPSTVRKASSSLSMSDSIRSVTNMVEQYRKSSSKKVTTKKRRIEDELDDAFDDGDVGSDDDDDVAMVSSKSSRNSSRKGESSRRCSKKRRIERESLDSDEDETGDELKSPPKSRLDRKVDRYENVHHRRTPPCKTPLTLSDNRLSGSRKSPSSTSHAEGHHTSKIRVPQDHPARRARIPQDDDTSGIHNPRNHPTPRSTPNASSVPSPVDVSMKTQRTASQVSSPAQSRRRSGDRTLRTPEGGGPGPSPRPTSRPMSLIATGLNRVELRQVEQLTSRLASCRFASAFNANTTHVIVKTDSSLVCERTLKYFQGIAARAWIVSFQWIHDSLKARKLLAEEDYEVKGDVVNGVDHHGPKRARTHEGPGFMAKFDLCCIGPFTGLNKDQLVGLCEMCGASTVQHPSLFPYNPGRKAFIIVEPNIDTDRDYQGLHRKFRVPVISREWVLDSIALYKSQPIADYLLSDLTSPMRDQPIIDLDSDDE